MTITTKEIKKHYVKGAIYSTAAFLIAFGPAICFNTFHFFGEKSIQFLQAASYILVGMMLYPRLNLLTWDQDSKEEQYDQGWFNIIAFASIIFTIFTITLRP